jgi:hypothetical protein
VKKRLPAASTRAVASWRPKVASLALEARYTLFAPASCCDVCSRLGTFSTPTSAGLKAIEISAPCSLRRVAITTCARRVASTRFSKKTIEPSASSPSAQMPARTSAERPGRARRAGSTGSDEARMVPA